MPQLTRIVVPFRCAKFLFPGAELTGFYLLAHSHITHDPNRVTDVGRFARLLFCTVHKVHYDLNKVQLVGTEESAGRTTRVYDCVSETALFKNDPC